MKKKDNKFDLNASLDKGAVFIYYIYTITSCLGYFMDIFNFRKTSVIIVYDNLTTILITIISFLLYLFKKLNLKVGFGIILYAALVNIFIGTFTDPYSEVRILFFLRDSLFIVFLITLSALIINKIHALIFTFFYIADVIILTVFTNNYFLIESFYLIILFVTVYAFLIYYFVNIIEHSIEELERDKNIILEKNEIVNETNTLLEERQQLIEEQSEILTAQTAVLGEQSEQLKVKNRELEQLNKTKDKFLSIMAHDLKNPLNVIINFADLLEKRYHDLDDEKRLKYLNILNVTSAKTLELLLNLLTWTRSQSSTISFEPENTNVGVLLEKNINLLIDNSNAKRINVNRDIQPGCMAYIDKNMIETVVRNLFSNAVKFTSKGGEISVGCTKFNKEIEVQIRDTGIGMDIETLENLFKLDKGRSRPGTDGETGTGLGLLLCKDFVEKNGGKLQATGKENEGSTFTFTLPVNI